MALRVSIRVHRIDPPTQMAVMELTDHVRECLAFAQPEKSDGGPPASSDRAALRRIAACATCDAREEMVGS